MQQLDLFPTRQRPQRPALLRPLVLLLLAAGLHGCERGADSGATSNPVAPGRPGTGQEPVEISPRPTSINESPQTGSARHKVPDGVTGSGGPAKLPGELQTRSHPPRQEGGGLHGGLDASRVREDPDSGAPARGTPNRLSDSAVGQR